MHGGGKDFALTTAQRLRLRKYVQFVSNNMHILLKQLPASAKVFRIYQIIKGDSIGSELSQRRTDANRDSHYIRFRKPEWEELFPDIFQ